jgi:hypothetical protein
LHEEGTFLQLPSHPQFESQLAPKKSHEPSHPQFELHLITRNRRQGATTKKEGQDENNSNNSIIHVTHSEQHQASSTKKWTRAEKHTAGWCCSRCCSCRNTFAGKNRHTQPCSPSCNLQPESICEETAETTFCQLPVVQGQLSSHDEVHPVVHGQLSSHLETKNHTF